MNERLESALTQEQSADVIRYYHKYAAAYGGAEAICLGQAAVRTTLSRFSMRPGGEPMLTPQEEKEGLELIENQESTKSDKYYDDLDHIVDTGITSYYLADLTLEAEGYK